MDVPGDTNLLRCVSTPTSWQPASGPQAKNVSVNSKAGDRLLSHADPIHLFLQGIAQAARYVYHRLVNDGILSQAFSVAPVRLLILYFLFLSYSVCSSGPQLPLPSVP